MHDTSMEEELDYDHGEEILLGGAKKLVIVSIFLSAVLPLLSLGNLEMRILHWLCWKSTGLIWILGSARAMDGK